MANIICFYTFIYKFLVALLQPPGSVFSNYEARWFSSLAFNKISKFQKKERIKNLENIEKNAGTMVLGTLC